MKDPFDDGRDRVLSDSQVKALERWFAMVAPRTGLAGWEFRVSPFCANSDSFATSFIREAADVVVVAVAKDFTSRTPDQQRATLGHELVHPHFQRVTALMDRMIEAELGKRTEAVMRSAVSYVEEQSVDRLGRAIARFLPYVDWGLDEAVRMASRR